MRWLRSEAAHDPEDHQRVALVWIDDAALAPESEGGYGPLGMWDRSIYRDTFARLEQFGVR